MLKLALFLFTAMVSIPATLIVGGMGIGFIQAHNHAMLSSDSVEIILGGTFIVLLPLLYWLLSAAIRYQEKMGGPSGFGG
ncbi:MAG: hypothetical protein HYT94_03920 [Parcubacteria group bacterium]|nr:hypothetical protein [Parcubacteria group bacterium]